MVNVGSRSLQRCSVFVSTILLSTGLSAGADLASANRAYEQKDYVAALNEFTALAEQGDAGAQLALGRMYMMGQGAQRDRDQAIKWFKAAAVQGNADAQFFLGSMYVLPQIDIPEGLKWLQLAANQGMQDAQYLLGKAYVQGAKELPPDLVQGAMWLRLAAKDNKQFYQSELDGAEKQMAPEQIAKAKALAAEWKPNPASKPAEKSSSK